MVTLFTITASAAWLLASAGVMKLFKPKGTAGAIRELLGTARGRGLARMLGATELATGLAFLISPGSWTGFAVGSLFLGLFVAATLLRSRDTECGCFGSVGGRVMTSHLAVTAVLSVAGFGMTLVGLDGTSSLAPFSVALAAIPVALLLYAVLVPLTELLDATTQLQP